MPFLSIDKVWQEILPLISPTPELSIFRTSVLIFKFTSPFPLCSKDSNFLALIIIFTLLYMEREEIVNLEFLKLISILS